MLAASGAAAAPCSRTCSLFWHSNYIFIFHLHLKYFDDPLSRSAMIQKCIRRFLFYGFHFCLKASCFMLAGVNGCRLVASYIALKLGHANEDQLGG